MARVRRSDRASPVGRSREECSHAESLRPSRHARQSLINQWRLRRRRGRIRRHSTSFCRRLPHRTDPPPGASGYLDSRYSTAVAARGVSGVQENLVKDYDQLQTCDAYTAMLAVGPCRLSAAALKLQQYVRPKEKVVHISEEHLPSSIKTKRNKRF